MRLPQARVTLWRQFPILAILVVAAAVRLPALPQKGIVDWDEASVLMHARLVASGTRVTLARIGVHLPEGQFVRPLTGFEADTRWGKLRGEPTSQHRPSHTLSLAFGLLFLGEYPWAGQAVTASFGVLTVALVYAFVRGAWGAASALVASALLAVSGFHALHSAVALPDAGMLLFWLAALLFYRRALHPGRWLRPSLAAGTLLGVAITFNERALLFFPALAASELFLWLRDGLARRQGPVEPAAWRTAIRLGVSRAMLVASGSMVAVGSIAGFLAGVYALSSLVGTQLPGVPWNYVESFAAQFAGWQRTTGISAAPLAQVLVFPYLTWRWDGLLAMVLVGAGTAAALIRRDRADLAVLAVLLVSWLFYARAPVHVAHYYLPATLAGAVLGGRWLALLPSRARFRVAGAVTVLAMALGAPRAASLAATPSGYRQAAEFAIRETGGKHLSNYWEITGFYTGRPNAIWPQGGMEAVRLAVAEGYWLAIIASTHDNPGQVPAWESLEGLGGAQLVAVVPNPAGASLANIHGGPRRGTTVAEILETESRASDTIRIYDLRPLLAESRP